MSAVLKAVEPAPLRNPLDEARSNFQNYTQGIAFMLSLSRGMISALYVIREWGFQNRHNSLSRDAAQQQYEQRFPTIMSHWVGYAQRLQRRGLVWHDYPTLGPGQLLPSALPDGHRFYKLTRAGELVCELLVEAGLMPAAEKRARRRMHK